MTNSPNGAAKGSTGSKKKPAKHGPVLPPKSGSDPGTIDIPKPDKGLLPQGTAPVLAEESGSDVGTDDKTKGDKGL
jgi:hypothetical protein